MSANLEKIGHGKTRPENCATIRCVRCNKPVVAQRNTRRYCSSTCRALVCLERKELL